MTDNNQTGLESVVGETGTVILDAQRPLRESRRSLLFHSPVRVLEAWRVSEVDRTGRGHQKPLAVAVGPVFESRLRITALGPEAR